MLEHLIILQFIIEDFFFLWPLGQTGPTSTIKVPARKIIENRCGSGDGGGVVDDLLHGCVTVGVYALSASCNNHIRVVQ